MREKRVVVGMTGASPVTPIHGFAWQSHAVVVSMVVTGLVPVMLPTAWYTIISTAVLILMPMGQQFIAPKDGLGGVHIGKENLCRRVAPPPPSLGAMNCCPYRNVSIPNVSVRLAHRSGCPIPSRNRHSCVHRDSPASSSMQTMCGCYAHRCGSR